MKEANLAVGLFFYATGAVTTSVGTIFGAQWWSPLIFDLSNQHR